MTQQNNVPIFYLSSLEDLRSKVNAIIANVKHTHYALLRGLFDRETIRRCMANLYSYANTQQHSASAGISREMIRTNMSKWSIGSQSTSQSGVPRFMLTIYNPLFRDDIFAMHTHFQRLIEVRDILAQRNEILFDEKLPSPHFNGARVQIYPRGGGFMLAHRDTRAQENLKGISDTYIQLVLLLTERGTDYQNGGAFTIDESDAMIDTEKDTFSGDILVYDGSTLHGVMDIDPALSFSASDMGGRAVALVTVYE